MAEDDMDKFQEETWFILILQFVGAVVGNGFAIFRFVARERPWHTGIIYSFNLAISDLLYALSLLPLAFYYRTPKTWTYGLAVCKLDRFIFFCNLYGSTFFVACISLNRCVAIVHPFFAHGRIEPRHAKLLSGAVWLLVVTISAPTLDFSVLSEPTNNTNLTNRTNCIGSAHTDQLPNYWPYSLFLFAFGCGLPFIITSVSCGAVLLTVLRNRNITMAEKRKVKVLVSMVVVLYIIFYLPYHILRNLNLSCRMGKFCHNQPSEDRKLLVHTLYQIAKFLVHFHICIHPLLYAALVHSMQEYCCSGCRRGKGVEEKNVELKLCN
ncbi:P2Y purinoceptor 11 [Hemicordylus capensis]|uniref:P2Y purinoceptor 11 n=1 Tax=Hemicordylus capensis TaxID=884348 RepID=UPI0023040FD8|nr:P2Y purinoceptor 11 [Hemicordylus capensis]XP_053143791.1 P2Y purinoceptor 11 [Hemicordylus capensis]